MEMTEKHRETLKRNNEESKRTTREAIKDALFILMKNRDYEEIRITDIIRKSGVSRSAFYRNYHTRDEVLLDGIGDMNDLLIQNFSQDVEENWRNYIQIIRKNRAKFELLIKAHREWFLLDNLNRLCDYDDEVVQCFMEACRQNAIIMLKGTIPKENIEKMMEKYQH